MDIILLKDIDNLGFKHDVVSVKNGYGRNYLIPQKMAVIANARNMALLDEIKANQAAKREAKLEEYRDLARSLEGKTLTIGAKAGTSGKIFGSVTTIQIVAALKDQLGLEVERRDIDLPEEVKNLGSYTATLKLHPDVTPVIHFEVVAE